MKTQKTNQEREWDALYNEGGEGYNPFREPQERENRPLTLAEKKDLILRELESKDNAIARESGTYDAEAIQALNAEYDRLGKEGQKAFAKEWTLKVTIARRAEWNARVKSGEFGTSQIDYKAYGKAQRDQGWTIEDLKKAIKINNIK